MREGLRAAECLEDLLGQVGPIEYGYRVQGLAAHLLLRMGAVVIEVNASGHPDIEALSGGGTLRLEVEVDVGPRRDRQPTADDLLAIRPRGHFDKGYFAYFVTGPRIRWLLASFESLTGRRDPIPIATVAALADLPLSTAWTEAMESLVTQHCNKLWSYSYKSLCRRALSGRGL